MFRSFFFGEMKILIESGGVVLEYGCIISFNIFVYLISFFVK